MSLSRYGLFFCTFFPACRCVPRHTCARVRACREALWGRLGAEGIFQQCPSTWVNKKGIAEIYGIPRLVRPNKTGLRTFSADSYRGSTKKQKVQKLPGGARLAPPPPPVRRATLIAQWVCYYFVQLWSSTCLRRCFVSSH